MAPELTSLLVVGIVVVAIGLFLMFFTELDKKHESN